MQEDKDSISDRRVTIITSGASLWPIKGAVLLSMCGLVLCDGSELRYADTLNEKQCAEEVFCI